MSKFASKFFCTVLFLCTACAAAAIEVQLEYVKYPDEQETYLPAGMARLTYKLDPPPGVWKFPSLVSAHPIYSLVELGDEKKLLVLDRQKTEDEYYNRIYFDADANKDLTDDPVIDGKPVSVPGRQYERIQFPAVDTEILIDGRLLPYSFRPDFMGRLVAADRGNISEELLNRMIYHYLRTNCAYRGKFEVAGESYTVYLGDSNCNGSFNEKFELRKLTNPPPGRMPIFNKGDSFFISRNGEIGASDAQVCGDWLLVKNRLFAVYIDQANRKMILTPVTQNLVPLRLAMKPEHISLYTEGGEHFLMTCRPDKKIDIPEGKYRLHNYRLLKKDDQGDLWSLSARATTESPWVNLAGKEESVLVLGEPFVVNADVPESGIVYVQGSTPAQISVFLLFAIRGQGDEDIQDLSRIKGDKTKIPLSTKEGLTHRPKEPTYKVLSEGKTVTQGSFEYG